MSLDNERFSMSAVGDENAILCPTCKGTGRVLLKNATVGMMILMRRTEAGLTQQELCERVGLSRAQIANIEGGRSDMPISRLQKFATALGCTMKDFFP